MERPGPQLAHGKRPRCCLCEVTWLDKNPFAAWEKDLLGSAVVPAALPVSSLSSPVVLTQPAH